MQTITELALEVFPDFQKNGAPITTFKYCQLLRGFRGTTGQPVLIKKFGGEIDQHIPEENRQVIHNTLLIQMEQYYALLQSHGVGVNNQYEVHKVNGSLLEATADGGANIYELLGRCTSDDEAYQLIKMIITCIQPILENPDIGIDPNPDNFVRAGDQVHYIDFLPPRYRTEDGTPLVGLPQPGTDDPMVDYLYQRYYQPEGALRRLWFVLTTLSTSYEELFFKAINQVLPRMLAQRVLGYFQGLPVNYLRELITKKDGISEIVKIIGEFDQYNIDDLRETSTLCCPAGHTRSWIRQLTGIDLFRPADERAAGVKKAKELIVTELTTQTSSAVTL